MKKYLWLLILLPLVGFAPAHFVMLGTVAGETMTWYQCRAEARKLNEEMTRNLIGAEPAAFRVSCRFGFGDASNSGTGERYVWTPNDEKVIQTLSNLGQLLHECKRGIAYLERRGHADKEGFKTAVKQCDAHERSYWDLLASTTDEQFDRWCFGNVELLNQLGSAVTSGCAGESYRGVDP